MGAQVLDVPDVLVKRGGDVGAHPPWNVTLHNDDHHTIQEVVLQVQKATGVSPHRAFEITMEVHTHGQSVCFTGTLDECKCVADVLREIALTVTLDMAPP